MSESNERQEQFRFAFPTGEKVIISCDVYGIYYHTFSSWLKEQPTIGEAAGHITLYDAIAAAWHEWIAEHQSIKNIYKNHPCLRCSRTGILRGFFDVVYCPNCFSKNRCPDCYGYDLFINGTNAICLYCGWELKQRS